MLRLLRMSSTIQLPMRECLGLSGCLCKNVLGYPAANVRMPWSVGVIKLLTHKTNLFTTLCPIDLHYIITHIIIIIIIQGLSWTNRTPSPSNSNTPACTLVVHILHNMICTTLPALHCMCCTISRALYENKIKKNKNTFVSERNTI